MVATEAGFNGLVTAIFDHLPLFFSGDRANAQAQLLQAGYKHAKQADGSPMLAMPVDEDAVCLFATHDKPLPKAKLIGDGAGGLFDRLAAEIRLRGFAVAAAAAPRETMRIETFSALEPGPIMIVTVMRPLMSDRLLLAAAMPPLPRMRRAQGN